MKVSRNGVLWFLGSAAIVAACMAPGAVGVYKNWDKISKKPGAKAVVESPTERAKGALVAATLGAGLFLSGTALRRINPYCRQQANSGPAPRG